MSAREVVLDGGSPWGFRMHGGVDRSHPLRVSRVNPGSKAALKGIREGDLISSINGQSTKSITNTDAHALLRNSGNSLKLGLNEDYNSSPKRRTGRPLQEVNTDFTNRSSETASVSSADNSVLSASSPSSTVNRLFSNLSETKSSVTNGYKHIEGPSEIKNYDQQSSNSSIFKSSKYSNYELQERGALIMADNSSAVSGSKTTSRRSRRSRRRRNKCGTADVTSLQQNVTTNQADDSSESSVTAVQSERLTISASSSIDENAFDDMDVDSDKKIIVDCDIEINSSNCDIVADKSDENNEQIEENICVSSETNDVMNPTSVLENQTAFINKEEVVNNNIDNVSSENKQSVNENIIIQSQCIPEIQTENIPGIIIDAAENEQTNENTTISTKPDDILVNDSNEEKKDKFIKNLSLFDIKKISTNIVTEIMDVEESEIMHEINYRVDSPPPIIPPKPKKTYVPKSRSLDDDNVQIAEVVELDDSTSGFIENSAIVLEADSDVEWETTGDLKIAENVNTTQNIVGQCLEATSIANPLIVPDDEESLRKFLEELPHIPSEFDVVSRVPKPDECKEMLSPESVMERRAKKRALLQNYFIPAYQNPRFLHVIDEEGSETSDKEWGEVKRTRVMSDSCIETKNRYDIDWVDLWSDGDDDVFMYDYENKFTKAVFNLDSPKAKLVNTTLFNVGNDIREFECTTNIIAPSANAEIVYIDDNSSNSDLMDQDLDNEKNEKTEENLNENEYRNSNNEIEKSQCESTIIETNHVKSEVILPLSHLTPPPTPDSLSSKNEDSNQGECVSPVAKEFIKKLLPMLAQSDNNSIYNLMKEVPIEELPTEMRETVLDLLAEKNFQIDYENLELIIQTQECKPICELNAIKEEENNVPVSENDTHETTLELCNKEIRSIINEDRQPTQSPLYSRPESTTSLSSSRSTSQSTVRFVPTSSSLADIADLLQREQPNDTDKVYDNPKTLRELCINIIVTFPFGVDMLEELATVSESLENMTTKPLPRWMNKYKSPIIIQSPTDRRDENACMLTNDHEPTTSCNTSNSSTIVDTMVKSRRSETWVGIPTQVDPKLLVCLSPSQRSYMENKTVTSTNNPDQLLDMHKKFIERRSYHEELNKPLSQASIKGMQIINEDKFSTKEGIANNENGNGKSCKRLLNIIRDSSAESDQNVDEEQSEKSPIKPKEFNIPIMLENKENLTQDRLSARRLSDWMQLARLENSTHHEFVENKKSRRASDVPCASTNSFEWLESFENKQRHSNTQPQTWTLQPSDDSGTKYRRYSLPQSIHQRQIQYILEQEREIERQIEQLEREKQRYSNEMTSRHFDANMYNISKKGDIAIIQNEFENINNFRPRPKSTSMIPGEFFRQQMYEEYMNRVAEMEDRKNQKVIKISSRPLSSNAEETASISEMSTLHIKQTKIENEFMDRVKERKDKLGIRDFSDSEADISMHEETNKTVLVLDGDSVKTEKNLPKHLQEFVKFTTDDDKEDMGSGVWSPGQQKQFEGGAQVDAETSPGPRDRDRERTPPLAVWTPRSATASPTPDRKEFRPVKYESPTLPRKNRPQPETPTESNSLPPTWTEQVTTDNTSNVVKQSSVAQISASLDRRMTSSHSAPATGFNTLQPPRLPKAQNPTITLLQKAREGQLPKGAAYIEDRKSRNGEEKSPTLNRKEISYSRKSDYLSESDTEGGTKRKMVELSPRKIDGIGPTTKDGMPIVLRSEVKENNQTKWYKRMYETLHKTKDDRRYPYSSGSGYLSEPEHNLGAYDSDSSMPTGRFNTLDRRRFEPVKSKENYTASTVPRNVKPVTTGVKYHTDTYKNQPGRIENYIPGHSSISDKEAKQWWDEVMDIFDGHLEQQKHVPSQTRSYMTHALKESGYESDSTLVFKRREDANLQLSPHEQKQAYKSIQRGGEVPLHGLRKAMPEKTKEPEFAPVPPPKGHHISRDFRSESPRRYVENEVTIHYRSPVRHEIKEELNEEELARRQAEAMRRIYQEERRRKYLQELQDMTSRRHTDNFTPSQKSPISLNRYDDFDDIIYAKSRDRTPEPRLVAKALFNFVGQTSRELTFKKGDIIYVRRQVDKNWYEGEHNAMVGLFPFNYVEIIPYDGVKTTIRKSHEGQARAKYNFVAQTHLELSLAKGELVILTRRVDENWFEGRIGHKKGIFPVSYVEILALPGDTNPEKPVATPAAHSLLLNGSSGGKQSMGSHHYQPSYSPMSTSYHHAKPVSVVTSTPGLQYGSLTRQKSAIPANQTLHVDTHSDPIPYRAMYKYRPQNEDELELQEGDIVYVLEKCDDGWFVGSSQRTGAFGTFPGNYVEKV